MTTFDRAVTSTLAHEGGYGDEKGDPGGETHYGISKKSYPNEDIKRLTKERAIELYRRDYWLPLLCDQLAPAVACKFFDMAVNMGKHRATMLLQDIVGAKVDGVMGPKTIAAANGFVPPHLVGSLCERQRSFYEGLISQRPNLAVFRNGWMTRARYSPWVG